MKNIGENKENWTTVIHKKKSTVQSIPKQAPKPTSKPYYRPKCDHFHTDKKECYCCSLVEKCELTLAWSDKNYIPNDYNNTKICDNIRLMGIVDEISKWKKGYKFITQTQDKYEIQSFDGKVLIANQWCCHNDTLNYRNAKNDLMIFSGRSVRITLKSVRK